MELNKNRNSKVNQKKSLLLVLGIIALVIIIFVVFKFLLVDKKPITFNEEYLEIEYGTEVNWDKTIKEVEPENAKIKYPNIELKEVGTYYLEFISEIDGKEIVQEQKFIVKDTTLPKTIKKIKGTVNVALDSQYDVFANVHEYKNLSDQAKQNKVLLSDKDYEKRKKAIEAENEKLGDREYRSKKDIKKAKVENNLILYKTNFDVTKEGKYTVTILLVDENYHTDEISWDIKVVPKGQPVNSGGSVVCTYPEDKVPSTEAYNTQYKELYAYDEQLLVSKLTFVTTMAFKDDYDSSENIQKLMEAINSKYGNYQEHKGISVEVQVDGAAVTTNIVVDFNEYDIKKDPLQLLESKKDGKVKIENVIERSKDKATCEIN